MTTITFLLTQGYADWEYAILAATARQWYGAETVFVSLGGGPVTSAGGVKSADLAGFDPAAVGQALVLVGGTAWRTDAPDIAGALAALPGETVIAAICDATRALAAAGMLNGVAHTSNDAETLAVPGYAGTGHFRIGAGAVRDSRMVTAAGVAPVAFMAEVLAALDMADDNLAYYRRLLAVEHLAPAS